MDPKKELGKISKMSAHELDLELKKYETQRWKENRGTKIEFNLNIKNKYKKFYNEIAIVFPDGKDGIGVEQLEEPFISLGLAYSREEVMELISLVDDDNSNRIEFEEFLRIIHNKSRKKAKDNTNITKFFKGLANNKIGNESDIQHFSFKTMIGIIRRNKLLDAFLSHNKDKKNEGEKILKAYSNLVERKTDDDDMK
jgi:centrin-1